MTHLKERFGCELITIHASGSFLKADGTPHASVYAFVRMVQGAELDVVIHVENEDQPVMPHTVHYICRHLQIPNFFDVLRDE